MEYAEANLRYLDMYRTLGATERDLEQFELEDKKNPETENEYGNTPTLLMEVNFSLC